MNSNILVTKFLFNNGSKTLFQNQFFRYLFLDFSLVLNISDTGSETFFPVANFSDVLVPRLFSDTNFFCYLFENYQVPVRKTNKSLQGCPLFLFFSQGGFTYGANELGDKVPLQVHT